MKSKIIIIPALLLSMQTFAADNANDMKVNDNDRSFNNTDDMKLDDSDRSTTNTNEMKMNDSDRSVTNTDDTKADELDRSVSKADNSKINERDRSANELTADQQGSESKDMSITRRIRSEIMKEKGLSAYAQNIKIITLNGKVTLKGPVRYEREQTNLLNHARSVAGASNVTNEIAVVPENK